MMQGTAQAYLEPTQESGRAMNAGMRPCSCGKRVQPHFWRSRPIGITWQRSGIGSRLWKTLACYHRLNKGSNISHEHVIGAGR
jgi:hypothetical protein